MLEAGGRGPNLCSPTYPPVNLQQVDHFPTHCSALHQSPLPETPSSLLQAFAGYRVFFLQGLKDCDAGEGGLRVPDLQQEHQACAWGGALPGEGGLQPGLWSAEAGVRGTPRTQTPDRERAPPLPLPTHHDGESSAVSNRFQASLLGIRG